MSGSVNKVILIGHLGKDPETKSTPDGRKVAVFSIATSESWRDKESGERKQRTEWHNVVIFNEPLVEIATKYLRKGSKAYIEGALQTRKWTDKGDVDHFRTEIVLAQYRGALTLLDRAEKAPTPDAAAYGTESTVSSGRGAATGGSPPMDDEIPF